MLQYINHRVMYENLHLSSLKETYKFLFLPEFQTYLLRSHLVLSPKILKKFSRILLIVFCTVVPEFFSHSFYLAKANRMKIELGLFKIRLNNWSF